MTRRAVVLALAAFAAVIVPAADGHAAGFSYAFAMPPQVTMPGTFTGAITAVASVAGDLTIDVTALDGTTFIASDTPDCLLTPGGQLHCVVSADAGATMDFAFEGAYAGRNVTLQTVASDAAGPVTFAPRTVYPVPAAAALTLPMPPTHPAPPITPSPAAAASPAELARQAAINRLQHRRARVVELTNGQRTRNGLGMLAVSADLQRSAQRYVNHLAADGAFSHTDGSVLADRVTATGYRYRVVGENLALGQTSASSVVAAWMASPDHRTNMLDRRFTEMGVGIVQRSDGRLLWCIDFGLPAS